MSGDSHSNEWDFLDAGGLTGQEIRAHDWSRTSLGPRESWPVSLRTTLATMLECPAAMFLAWGPDLLSFYNDAYRPVFGERLPRALGTPFREIWGDLWEDIGPLVDAALAGERVLQRDRLLMMNRHGTPEQSWWTFSYSPVRDDGGAIAGMICVTSETTAQVVAERLRREADARMEMALSAGNGVGTWDWDVAADRVTADARFAGLYGVDPAEAAAGAPLTTFFGAMHPDDLAPVREAIGRALRGGETFSEEYRLVQPDGSVRWVTAQGRCQLAPDGTPVRFPGVSFDITDRKAVEAALHDSEAKFRGIVNSIDQMIWSTQPDGFHDYYNDRWYEYTGAPYGSTDGEGWNGMFHPDDQDRAWSIWRHSLESGEPYQIEYRLRHRSGAYRWVLGRAQAVRDARGTITRWFGTCTDVHDLKVAEERLRESEERLRLATEHAEVGFWDVDPINDVLVWPPRVKAMFGISPEVPVSMHDFYEGLHPDDQAATGEAYAASADPERRALYDVEYRTVGKEDGLIRWVAAKGRGVFDETGCCIRVVGTAIDVTERKAIEARLRELNETLERRVEEEVAERGKTEEALRQAQKMEAVGQLTGGIAHDFNNLLTGIVGSLDLMRTRIRQGRTDTLEKYATAAMSSANRAAALTHRLLAFARRQPLEQRPVAANALIAGMEDMLRRTLTERVHLEIITAGGLWPTLCDPHQLENAILNLAINARDAMPDGGRLVIETCNTHLDRAYVRTHPEVSPGQYVCVCVTDSGTGMPAEIVARAFEPFFTTKPLGMGTGLGLSMIYGFARQSEGHAKIYSEAGQGTTVKIYLPRYRGEIALDDAANTAGEAPRAERGETVLVVEDEPVVRDLVVEVLRDLGYRALEAQDGPAGLKILQSRKRIDLLITDVGLPGMNGRQVADQARDFRPDLKVLFITGYAENAMFGVGALAPGMQMMTKPFPVDALASRIREMIET